MVELAACVVGVGVAARLYCGVGSTWGKSSCQRPVAGVRVPRRTGRFLLNVMETVLAVKVATHPWSHRVPMEMREPEARVGKMWAWQA
jgi:hypothetical protein